MHKHSTRFIELLDLSMKSRLLEKAGQGCHCHILKALTIEKKGETKNNWWFWIATLTFSRKVGLSEAETKKNDSLWNTSK